MKTTCEECMKPRSEKYFKLKCENVKMWMQSNRGSKIAIPIRGGRKGGITKAREILSKWGSQALMTSITSDSEDNIGKSYEDLSADDHGQFMFAYPLMPNPILNYSDAGVD